MNTSPSIAPRLDRSSSASGKRAFGDSTCFARVPPQLAGESRKMRECCAATTEDIKDTKDETVSIRISTRGAAPVVRSPVRRSFVSLCGERRAESEPPPHEHGSHGETGADRRQEHEVALFQPPRRRRVVQR